MSALAQYYAALGGRASGSDRAFDLGQRRRIREHLEAAGVEITTQDGCGFGPGCLAVVVSTAIEADIPDVAAAREMGVPILHRSELLARFVERKRTIAVTGTSGKSTVTAMIFEILRACGRDPSVLTGGPLALLEAEGLLGNAWFGDAGPLVIEADESDGSLVRYSPWASVILNLQRDHKEPEEVGEMFRSLKAQTSGPLLLGEDPALDFLASGATRFGIDPGTDLHAEDIVLESEGSAFRVEGTRFFLPAPGLYNVRNALAAIAACRETGLEIPRMADPLGEFRGVARRFQTVGQARGVTVIDDFAHNPEKIRAAISAAHLRDARLLIVFQPHGFGPTRFLKNDLIAAFRDSLRRDDMLWLTEIYYAGGTVVRDISSADLVKPLSAGGCDAHVVPDREDLPALIASQARDGDVVLVMGARDPSLTTLCRRILEVLAAG